MPELPEVETIKRTLTPRLVGRTIERVEVRTPKFVVGATPDQFRRLVEGTRISALDRRGKYLIFSLDGLPEAPADSDARPVGAAAEEPAAARGGAGLLLPAPGDIIIHLKMAGQLVWSNAGDDLGLTRSRHTHVIFHLDDGSELRYVDTRHFGRVYFAAGDPGDPILRRALTTIAGLGREPLDEGLEWPAFQKRMASRQARVKPLLLDQAFVAGLGNIYADECLFRARIHPLRRASSLQVAEVRRLYQAMKEVIAEAIELRGTSVRDYVDGEGREGSFKGRLNVYGRKGEPCPLCGSKIERIVVGGRGTHFCPKCQKTPRTDV